MPDNDNTFVSISIPILLAVYMLLVCARLLLRYIKRQRQLNFENKELHDLKYPELHNFIYDYFVTNDDFRYWDDPSIAITLDGVKEEDKREILDDFQKIGTEIDQVLSLHSDSVIIGIMGEPNSHEWEYGTPSLDKMKSILNEYNYAIKKLLKANNISN
jgi:hypothetical protein